MFTDVINPVRNWVIFPISNFLLSEESTLAASLKAQSETMSTFYKSLVVSGPL